MTVRRALADFGISLLHGAARLPGRRFYRLYLDELNRRYNDNPEGVTVTIGERKAVFAAPNQVARWRAETLFQKEPATIAWIDGFDAGEVFWDVGANIGIYAVYAAMARKSRVMAFEPVPDNHALLVGNIIANGLSAEISAMPVALAASSRIAPLSIPDRLPGSAFARFGGTDKSTASIAALGVSIDDFVGRFNPPFPAHIKIDVDGTETDILKGANATLADQRLKSLSIEVDDTEPQQADEIAGILSGHGFAETGSFRSPLFPDSPSRNVQYRRRG